MEKELDKVDVIQTHQAPHAKVLCHMIKDENQN